MSSLLYLISMEADANLSNMLHLSSRTSTFLSVDVVGSTQIKTGQNEQDIIYTFLAYHKLVSELAYARHGEVTNITGDGMMCRFQRADDAADLTHDLLDQLSTFNKKHNRLTQPIALRLGVHTGEVFENESMASGQIISKTIDIAAKLQQNAETNHAHFSEATASLLGERAKALRRMGWNAELGTNVYDYAAGGPTAAGQGRKLPDPIRTLIVEPELNEIAKLKKILFGHRYEPFTVYNQNQAGLAIGSWPPHLILLSLDLQWKTGWEFLTSLRGDGKMSHIPIIALSQQTTGEVIQRSFKIGANGFLRKPLDEQQVLKRIEMVLREFYL
jgi:class 3 adenylate cyclase/CheY-like chemotaxis protein